MNITKLREVAAHHVDCAVNLERALHAATEEHESAILRRSRDWHATAARELTELADAFSSISTLLIQP